MRLATRLLALLVLTCIASNVSAATTDAACAPNCYVATNGNDGTGNGTIGSPWASLIKCFNEVHAGGTCWFRGGTYEAPDTSSDTGADNGYGGWTLGIVPGAAYQVVGNRRNTGGSAGNPVTIRSYPGETVIFAQDAGDYCKDLINGFDVVAYVQFLDITFKSGRTFFSAGCHDITFERNIFKYQYSSPFGDVPAMLMSGQNDNYSCTNFIVRNNLFISDSADNTNHNSCVTYGGQVPSFTEFYSWSNGLLEHNDFVITANSGNPSIGKVLGYKNSNQTTTIRNNYFFDGTNQSNTSAIWVGGSPSGGVGQNKVYNNITSGVEAGVLNELTIAHDNQYYNNTFYNVRGGCWRTLADNSQSVVNNEFFNNICVVGTSTSDLYVDFGWWSDGETESVDKQDMLDWNIYSKLGTGSRRWKDGGDESPARFTFDNCGAGGIACWQNYLDTRSSPAPTFEGNSRLTDPGITNPGAEDFSLAIGAAARTGGRGGAYPTYLGADDPNSSADYVGCTFDPRCHSYTLTPDTTPPVRSEGAPTGELSAGTTQTNITLTTDENATCKWDVSSGTAYASMPNTFSTTGGTSHSTLVTGLSDGNSYTYYVRCSDVIPNVNTTDYQISFSVASGTGPGAICGAVIRGGTVK